MKIRTKFCWSCNRPLDSLTSEMGLCADCLEDEADEFAVHGDFPPDYPSTT